MCMRITSLLFSIVGKLLGVGARFGIRVLVRVWRKRRLVSPKLINIKCSRRRTIPQFGSLFRRADAIAVVIRLFLASSVFSGFSGDHSSIFALLSRVIEVLPVYKSNHIV